MNRRGFLKLFAVALALPFRGYERLLARFLPGADPEAVFAARLLQAFPAQASAAAVGRHYLLENRGEATRANLLAAIRERLPASTVQAEAAALRQSIREAIRDDFAHARTEDVGGWMLSGTEARLCALAALSRRRA